MCKITWLVENQKDTVSSMPIFATSALLPRINWMMDVDDSLNDSSSDDEIERQLRPQRSQLRPSDPEDAPPITELDVARDKLSDEVHPMPRSAQRQGHGRYFDAVSPVPLGLEQSLAGGANRRGACPICPTFQARATEEARG